MTRFRKGDVVTIEGVVAAGQAGCSNYVDVELRNGQSVYVPDSDLTLKHHEIRAGDYVIPRDFKSKYRVLAVHDGCAWARPLRRDGTMDGLFEIDDLIRIDPPADDDPA